MGASCYSVAARRRWDPSILTRSRRLHANSWRTTRVRRVPLSSVRPVVEWILECSSSVDFQGAAGYLFGNAGTGQTHRANRRAFERWEIVPRMLRDASQRSLEVRPIQFPHFSVPRSPFPVPRSPHSAFCLPPPRILSNRTPQTTLFGTTLPSPLVIAPIAAQSLWHADAECGTARAAGALGIPVILSGASSRSLESVAAANGANSPRWFQLYW